MKTLIIVHCNQCPHFKTNHIHGIDDAYLASCYHPDLEQPFEWQQKRGRNAEIPRSCPLPNVEDLQEKDIENIKRHGISNNL